MELVMSANQTGTTMDSSTVSMSVLEWIIQIKKIPILMELVISVITVRDIIQIRETKTMTESEMFVANGKRIKNHTMMIKMVS